MPTKIAQLKKKAVEVLKGATEIIALFVCAMLIIASVMILWEAFRELFTGNTDIPIQDGLFVIILLEMFYVIRSFIKYGSINVSIVINIGLIAAIKELIFKLDSLTIQTSLAFGAIFVSLGFLFFAEIFSYEKKQARTKF